MVSAVAVVLSGCIGAIGGGAELSEQATARVVRGIDDLVGGPAAQGRPGDIVLENQHVRVIVEALGDPVAQLGPYGGNLIDADTRRRGSEPPADGPIEYRTGGKTPLDPGNDVLGELIPWHNFGRTVRPTRLVIVDDGAASGRAVVEVVGNDALLHTVHARNAIERLGGNAGAVYGSDFNPAQPLPLEIRTRYILGAGEQGVLIETTYVNRGDAPIDLVVGDVLDVRGDGELFLSAGAGLANNEPSPGFGLPTGIGAELAYERVEFAAWARPGLGMVYRPWVASSRRHGQSSCLQLDDALACLGGVKLRTGAAPLPYSPGLPEAPAAGQHLRVPPAGEGVVSFRRFLWLGPHIADAMRGQFREDGTPTGVATVRVGEQGTNEPIAGVDLAILARDDTDRWLPWLHATTDERGEAHLRLPAGHYRVLAQDPRRGTGGSDVPPEVALSIVADAPARTYRMSLPAPKRLELFTQSDARVPTPMRVTVLGTGARQVFHGSSAGATTEPSAGSVRIHPFGDPAATGLASPPGGAVADLRDMHGDPVPAWPVAAVVDTGTDGMGTVELPPGDYVALASRGPAWDVQAWPVRIGGGSATQRLLFTLRQVVDDYGWLEVDAAAQGQNTYRGGVAYDALRAAAVAEGLDLVNVADADTIVPALLLDRSIEQPRYTDLGPGVEVHTTDGGRFSALALDGQRLPLKIKPVTAAGEALLAAAINGGAPLWWDTDANAARPAAAVLNELATLQGLDEPFVFVRHPRTGGHGGWFDALDLGYVFDRGYDSEDLANAAPEAAPSAATQARIAGDPPFSDAWQGLQIADGQTPLRHTWAGLNDAIAFWNLGKRAVVLGGSGSTRRLTPPPGSPRTWVLHTMSENPAMAVDANTPNLPARVAADLAAGRGVASNGPWLDLQLSGALIDRRAGVTTVVAEYASVPVGGILHVDRSIFPITPGQTHNDVDFELVVTATVRVQAPLWAPFGAVELFQSAPALQPGTLVRDDTGSALSAVTMAGWTFDAAALDAAVTAATVRRITAVGDAVTTVSTGGQRYDWTGAATVTIDDERLLENDPADLWFAARVLGDAVLYPIVVHAAEAARPVAIGNAVFVDLGGDLEGTFGTKYKGPCELQNSPDCPN